MTGLTPAGALPLQAARSVANFAQEVMKGQSPLSVWGLSSEGVELFGRSEALGSILSHVNDSAWCNFRARSESSWIPIDLRQGCTDLDALASTITTIGTPRHKSIVSAKPIPTEAPQDEPGVQESSRSTPEAERRQLTVMFCDLADSTRLSQQLDATTLGARFVVLTLRVVSRGCGIPVAWTVSPANQPGSWRREWLRLLRGVRPAIPPDWTVLVLADRGLWTRWLFGRIGRLGWHPLLRINNGAKCRPAGPTQWSWRRELVRDVTQC